MPKQYIIANQGPSIYIIADHPNLKVLKLRLFPPTGLMGLISNLYYNREYLYLQRVFQDLCF